MAFIIILPRGGFWPHLLSLHNYYAKRWGIESSFRDTKDLRFGMGMSSVRIGSTARRDRLWLLNAFAVVLLSLLGAAGETLGYVEGQHRQEPYPLAVSARLYALCVLANTSKWFLPSRPGGLRRRRLAAMVTT